MWNHGRTLGTVACAMTLSAALASTEAFASAAARPQVQGTGEMLAMMTQPPVGQVQDLGAGTGPSDSIHPDTVSAGKARKARAASSGINPADTSADTVSGNAMPLPSGPGPNPGAKGFSP